MIFEIDCKVKLLGMKQSTRQAIMGRLTIDNPKYAEAEKMGRWTGNIEPVLRFYEETGQGFVCPRGAARQVHSLCRRHGEQINIIDNRRILPRVEFEFHGALRAFQEQPVDDCLARDSALLSAPTGSGKTCMGLYMIAQRQQPALIVVHTKELLTQWQDRIDQFLGIEAGIIGGGKFDIKPVTVATVQSLAKCASDIAEHFGYLVLDECHRAPAMQYVQAIGHFDCKYMTGLSATPYRRDGLSKVIFWHIGDVAGQVEKTDLLDTGNLCSAELVWIDTDFNTQTDASEFYSRALSELTEDAPRNRLICHTVAENEGQAVSVKKVVT
jgi:superfamily II DNA or RNA helicase